VSNLAISIDCFAASSGPTGIKGILGTALRADYDPSAGFTLDGSGNIQQLNDQSGSLDANQNAVQASAGARPGRVASNAGYNGKPTVTCTSATMLQTGVWATPLAGPTTIFVVGDGSVNYFTTSLVNNLGIFQSGSLKATNQSVVLDSSVSVFATPSIVVVVFNGASSTIAVRQNTPQITGNAGLGSATGLTLGAYSSGFGLNGSWARIAVADGVVSATNIAKVTAYLATTYGLVQGP